MISLKQGEIFFDWPILILTLFIGLFLIRKKPYIAFLFATLVSLSFGKQTLLFSKIPGLGFITLIDICLLLSIAAFLRELFNGQAKLKIPLCIVGIMVVLIIGFSQSLIRYDQTYAIVRAFRWAIGLPILCIISASMVKNKERAKSLLWVLLVAAILSSLQHLFYISQTRIALGTDSADSLRTIAFIRGQESWLAAGPFIMAGRIPYPIVQGCIGILFLFSFFAQQTRSVAIGIIITLIIYYGWFLRGNQVFSLQRFLPLILTFAISITVISSFGLGNFAENYLNKLTDLAVETTNINSRAESFDVEIRDWMDGNFIFGEGLAYFFRIGIGSDFELDVDAEGVAYGHLGYVTYLSQLGIVGFLVYGIWFPLAVILRAKKVFKVNYKSDQVRHLAGLTVTTFLSSVFTFFFSSSFINPYVIIPGILAGAVWAMPTKKQV